jgi:RecB family exonuclease
MSDFRLSVSKVKTFDACKKQYHFNYILRLPPQEKSYTIYGRFIHLILETFHLAYLQGSISPNNQEMEKAFKFAFNSSEFQGKLSKDAQKDAYKMCDEYLQKLASEKDNAPTIIGVEKAFNIRLTDHVVLNGLIDRVQMDPDGVPHVLDYKTTKNQKYLTNDFKQLLTYAFALLNEDPTIDKVRGSYILLRHNFKYITTEFKRDEIMAIGETYKASAEKMEAETEWRANPTILCGWCSYLEHCAEGQKQVAKYNPNPDQIQIHGATTWK